MALFGWRSSARKGEDTVQFVGCCPGDGMQAVWIWQNQNKDTTSKHAGPDLWFPFLGFWFPFHLPASRSILQPQKSFPSQPGQSINPDLPKHGAARQLYAQVLSIWAGAAQCKTNLIKLFQTVPAISFTKAPQAFATAYQNTTLF